MLRAACGLPASYQYTQPIIQAGVTIVRASDLSELRDALCEAYDAAGQVAPPSNTNPTIGAGDLIRVIDIAELRAGVQALEGTCGGGA